MIIIFLGKSVLSELFKAWGPLHGSTLSLIEWETTLLEEGREGRKKGNSEWSLGKNWMRVWGLRKTDAQAPVR